MLDKIITFIENESNLSLIKETLDKYHDFEIAQIISELSEEKQTIVLSLFSDSELADILSYMDKEDTSEILSEITEEKAASIISEMEPDDATDILDEIDEEQAEKIINLLDEETKEDIEELSKYDDDLAGALMTTSFLKAYENSDVKDAMRILVKEAPEVETISTLMIVDENERLKGTLELKKLIVTKSPMQLKNIMTLNPHKVLVNDKIEQVVELIRNYDLLTTPVVDENGIIKGIITTDDAFDALTQVVEEDYAKLAGLTSQEESDDEVASSIKKRIPWLLVLLVLDIFVALIIGRFEKVIAALPILTFFQAAVLGLAGNSGTQSLAVAVRRLSENKEHTAKNIFKHLGKEFLLGLLTGALLGLISFALVFLMLTLKQETMVEPFKMGLVLALSIFIALVASNFFGALIPLIFYKLKIDPAVASGPFITTINDIMVVLIYFTIASILLL